MGRPIRTIKYPKAPRHPHRHVRETPERALEPQDFGQVRLWKEQIEQLAQSLDQPLLFQGNSRLGALEELAFSVEIVKGRLLARFHVGGKSLMRRITQVAVRGEGCLQLQTKRLTKLECFEIRSAISQSRAQLLLASRKDFQKVMEALVVKNFPRARILHSSVHSDLEHSLSGKYVRLLFTSGANHWAAIAVSSGADQTAIDGVLSSGLIWREQLRLQSRGFAGKLLLIVPVGRALVVKSRLSLIRGAGTTIHLMELDDEREALTFVDLKDSGNIDTVLTQLHALQPRKDYEHSEKYCRVMNLAPGRIQAVYRHGVNTVSFRILGLEFAQLRMGQQERLVFGVDTQQRFSSWAEIENLVQQILHQRHAGNRNHVDPFYRLQPERWLESLILRDVCQIDSHLDAQFVYPQVPAFLAGDRGMIDILTVNQCGRLAILELKVSEDIELPLQGLDYWLRVRWHLARGEFASKGYFPGRQFNDQAPLLYLVCPQFCYHSTFPQVASSVVASVPMIQVGINQNWRAGIQVVLRKEWNLSSSRE